MEINKNDHDKIIGNLDFSGEEKSYFDFWHLHYDFDGNGNKSFEKRKEYLNEAFRIYNQLQNKLQKYPNEFQLWIGIDEVESGDDGIYIHTKNPNSDYFPHLVENEKIEIVDMPLYSYLENSGFEIINSKNDNTNYFYLYKNDTGVSLEKRNAG
ncbi:hypothetical protein G4D82_14145 [Flavobacterium sp. CYK-4]|uniref:hypothetical protein n=1 Tax=Flavobacterium lotistagni TaxID=2709660 RepID=UPI00140D054D|nr:hypothetical protein [Flavobacterium lotistagni]NHM08366.1 hypothetical protein [Flavobacterium lotistagni]